MTAATIGATRGRPPRGGRASLVNAGVSAAVLLLIAVVVLNPTNQPPPAIAELAPQPQKQITEAPQEQSSQFGKGAPGDAARTRRAVPPRRRPPYRSACRRYLAPVSGAALGNPPRQIEDPQSPPCVAFWEGTDNGGATAKGVTADEIRIAVAEWNDEIHPPMQAFLARFPVLRTQDQAHQVRDQPGQPAEQQADAQEVDEQLQVFASMSGANGGGYFYHRESLAPEDHQHDAFHQGIAAR